MKKSLTTLALAGSIALIGSASAVAATPAPYPAPSQNAAVSDATVAPGEPIAFSGGGMTPGEDVQITATQTSTPQAIGGSYSGAASMAVPAKIILPLAPLTFIVQARADGTFTSSVTLAAEGIYTLRATGLTSGNTVTATVTVDAAFAGSGTGNSNTVAGTTTKSGLADTGADTGLVLWSLVGAGALAAGVASVVVVRRRAKGVSA